MCVFTLAIALNAASHVFLLLYHEQPGGGLRPTVSRDGATTQVAPGLQAASPGGVQGPNTLVQAYRKDNPGDSGSDDAITTALLSQAPELLQRFPDAAQDWDRIQGVPAAGAIEWYRKAAELGDAAAKYTLGVRYEAGIGVPRDATEAVRWYREAAEQGNARAQGYLGACYEAGYGVPKDATEAAKWYRRAAEQGNAQAQCGLGACYANGRGVAANYAEALNWFRKAADQGNIGGQRSLGVCYENGFGVEQDYAEAMKWYRRAAEQGDAQAQWLLGARYAFGIGVTQNLVEAHVLCRLAAAGGVTNASGLLDRLSSRMTPEQMAEAQRLFSKGPKQKASNGGGPK